MLSLRGLLEYRTPARVVHIYIFISKSSRKNLLFSGRVVGALFALNLSPLDGPIRANRFADSRESPDSRDSREGSRANPLFYELGFAALKTVMMITTLLLNEVSEKKMRNSKRSF